MANSTAKEQKNRNIRSVVISDDLWERAEKVAQAMSERENLRVTVSDLIRRGLIREIEGLTP